MTPLLPRSMLLVVLCLGTSGCWFGKKAALRVPPPAPLPQPAAFPPVAIEPPPPPPQLEAEPLPLSSPSVVEKLEPVPVPEPTPKDTVPPKPVVRRNPAAPVPPASGGEPVPPAGPVPVSPLPQLSEIISGDRRRAYEAEFSQGVARASAALRQATTRNLDAGQQETVTRIRTFLAQASAARDNDISTALQLARRADLLGQELVKSLR